MAGEPVCEVPDCTKHPTGKRGLSSRYCTSHLRRLSIYGSAVDWQPIPLSYSPGAEPDYVRLVAALPWPQLTNWVELALNEACTCGGPCRLSAMDDDEFGALFARTFPSR